MRCPRLTCFLFAALLCGCASTKSISQPVFDTLSQPSFLTDCDDIDTIEIGELTLTGRKQVSRFVKVCRNAKWAPYLATMPGDVKKVRFLSDGVEVHQLLYGGGWLIDTSGDGPSTFGTILAEDGNWFSEHIDEQLKSIDLGQNAL